MLQISMRRALLASGLAIGTALSFSPIARADSANGNVGGTVAPINNVDYTAPSTATLNPSAGNTNQSFGSVFVQNNDNDGWTLTVASGNSGKLHDAVSGTDIAYTGLTATATSGDLNTAPVSLSVGSGNAVNMYSPSALTCAASSGCNISLDADIASEAVDGMAAGTYSDTLTFNLTNK